MRLRLLTFTLAASVALGLGLTYASVTHLRGMDAVRSGAWTGWPHSGTTQIDPYARAAFARSGELPVELADGLLFLAETDESGKPLDGRCDIRLSGTLPQARIWTLTLMDGDGQLIANDAQRFGFTSNEVVYRPDGGVDVAMGPRAMAGNWVPSGGRERVKVALRLYDAPFSFSSSTGDGSVLPRIVMERCP